MQRKLDRQLLRRHQEQSDKKQHKKQGYMYHFMKNFTTEKPGHAKTVLTSWANVSVRKMTSSTGGQPCKDPAVPNLPHKASEDPLHP